MSPLPSGIDEMLTQRYGHGPYPDYGFILEEISRDPYGNIRRSLEGKYRVLDLTDPNSDASFVYVLIGHPEELTVRLSLVGPFAVLLSPRRSRSTAFREVVADAWVEAILSIEGVSVLGKAVLGEQVSLCPSVTVSLYEALFEFDSGLPWDR